MNGADIVVIVLLSIALAAAVFVIVRNKRKGKSGCCGDCYRCGGCRKKTK